MIRTYFQMLIEEELPDATGKMAPRLATAWKNIDTTTWEFTLRNDVKFADGQPFVPSPMCEVDSKPLLAAERPATTRVASATRPELAP